MIKIFKYFLINFLFWYFRLKQDPVPYIHAEFLPSNILEWHYIIEGPKDSPYYGGYYHGSLIFTKDFPFKPPSIYSECFWDVWINS